MPAQRCLDLIYLQLIERSCRAHPPTVANNPLALIARYVTYAKSWFEEVNNIGLRDAGKKNYLDLPPLLTAPPARGGSHGVRRKTQMSPQKK